MSSIGVREEDVRAEWLRVRNDPIEGYLGASEIAAVCGMSKWSTPRHVFMVKKGLVTVEDNLPMKVGRMLEPLVAQEFADYVGIPFSDLRKGELTRHHKYGFLGCNPDYLWDSPEGLANIQCKTCGQYASGDFGQSGTDEVKEEYLIQSLYEMSLVGAKVGYLPVLIGNSEFKVFKFTWTDTARAIATRAFEDARSFWFDHFLADVPPPLMGADIDRQIVTDMYRSPDDVLVNSNADIEKEVEGFAELQAQAEQLEAEINRRKNVFREFIGKASGVHTTAGIVTWRENKNGQRSLRLPFKKGI